MIEKDACIPLLLEHFPGFQERWKAHQDWWDGDPAGLCNDCSAFALYTEDCVHEARDDELARIFGVLETLMVEGCEEVKNAVATCILENLLNYVSAGSIDADRFIHLLGPHSRAYCKAWDAFTGVATPGLWPSGMPGRVKKVAVNKQDKRARFKRRN